MLEEVIRLRLKHVSCTKPMPFDCCATTVFWSIRSSALYGHCLKATRMTRCVL
jgi:hypothetical protein